MEDLRAEEEELRTQLMQLIEKQQEVQRKRMFGSATDTELLEYDVRQQIIHEICEKLLNSSAQHIEG